LPFPPEEQSYGVQRFFRSWGGESLYADHERDPKIGPVLKQIGIPCVVELMVPIQMMRSRNFLITMPQHYLGAEKGVLQAEGHSSEILDPSRIVKINKRPSSSFEKLSGGSRHENN